MKKRDHKDLCHGPLFRGIVGYTIPIILTGILHVAFNAADLMVVGQFAGSASVAAVGATSSLTTLLVNFFMGISVGAGVATAQGIGAGEDDHVRRTVHTAIPTALIIGSFLSIVGILFSKTFLHWMGTPDDVLPLAALYMRIYFAGMIANMVYNFGAAILRAVGETKKPLYFLTCAGILNVSFNLFFVAVLHWDVAGVAVATMISQVVSATLVVIELTRRKDACRLQLRKLKIDMTELKKIISIGVPAGIQSSLFAISNVIIQSSVNSFGTLAVSGNAAASNLEGFTYTAMNAFHQTALNYVGQNYGAKKFDRIKRICLICYACVSVVGITVGGLLYIFREPLLSIYITDSAEAISYGVLKIIYVGLPYFLCGIMEVSTGALRAMGGSLISMIVSIFGVCVFRVGWIFTIFQIPKFHSMTSLFISYPISWTVTFAALTVCLYKRYRKEKNEYPEKNKVAV